MYVADLCTQELNFFFLSLFPVYKIHHAFNVNILLGKVYIESTQGEGG